MTIEEEEKSNHSSLGSQEESESEDTEGTPSEANESEQDQLSEPGTQRESIKVPKYHEIPMELKLESHHLV